METTGKVQKDGKIYLSISHEVTDYAVWKSGFDQHKPVRTEAGISEVFVKQDATKKNGITAFFEVKDMKKAQAFLSAPQLKEAMLKAGVINEPEIHFYTSASSFDTIDTSALVTTVSHSVKDFSVWKGVYDSAAEMRASAGTKDYHLLRSLADENVVTVMGTASSQEKFNNFMSNPNLKGAMEAAGVTSKPEVKILL